MSYAGDRRARPRMRSVWWRVNAPGARATARSAGLLFCALAAGCSNPSMTASNGGGARQWAAWPMPNGPADVAAGAPNAMTYTMNGDGTVTDEVTHLMWQRAVPATTYRWTDASAYCRGLTLGGHRDWYLPTEIQLISLVDGGVASGPTIDAAVFPDTPAEYFWSSVAMATSPDNAWLIDFNMGSAYSAAVAVADYVRCVRDAVPLDTAASPGRYGIGSDSVYDTRTELTWQRSAPSTALAPNDARTYCESGGDGTLPGTGWRLPTEKELLTLVDYDVGPPGPTLDAQVFPGTVSDFYGSASPLAHGEAGVWFVDFSTGNATNYAEGPESYVRCVR